MCLYSTPSDLETKDDVGYPVSATRRSCHLWLHSTLSWYRQCTWHDYSAQQEWSFFISWRDCCQFDGWRACCISWMFTRTSDTNSIIWASIGSQWFTTSNGRSKHEKRIACQWNLCCDIVKGTTTLYSSECPAIYCKLLKGCHPVCPWCCTTWTHEPPW